MNRYIRAAERIWLLVNVHDEKEWGEYLVCWNKDRIELYEDYVIPGKEWLLGRKHLAHSIPRLRVATRLSVFSYVDMSFSLVCAAEGDNKLLKSHRTTVFVMRCSTRSRSIDWIWSLWRFLGGVFPAQLDVHVPVLGTKISLDVPRYDIVEDREGFRNLTPDRIIELCEDALRNISSYSDLMNAGMKRGARLALAWRHGMNLEWAWLKEDIHGRLRDWAGIFGWALQQRGSSVQLELRLASHSQSKLKLTSGSMIHEPDAIEGYLYQIRPNSQSRTAVYVSTHSGNLFTMTHWHAFPPSVPELRPNTGGMNRPRAQNELRRGSDQVLHANGFLDLRDILSVRKALAPLAPSQKIATLDPSELGGPILVDVDHDDDLRDVFGQDATGIVEDELSGQEDETVRMKKSFEIVMRTGAVIRFELPNSAHEWITRLRTLVRYWAHHHRQNARTEMDLEHFNAGKPRFEKIKRSRPQASRIYSGTLPDVQEVSRRLSTFWSWCVLAPCRPLIKSGKLFAKTKPRAHYKHTFMTLTAGHIATFSITAAQSCFHQRSRVINLVNSYVYSGLFAASDATPRIDDAFSPRLYQDGLESDDSDVDTIFVVRYHLYHGEPQPRGGPHAAERSSFGPPPPPRSTLERDAWCWAINTEVERIERSRNEVS
ncbi:Pleckstrin homology domain-containing protein [Cantharellus anzutake]|uniref:Pleckstrin homology domain-containing protein n=1 Tax=Cantharellus anzutake TaxID=1750568 RepID=UPI001906D111|nr:Pleckstrin homology domain-containing protein [Cantharellus anzutake]KAF8333544.1 Pleckstrin homology domain-containing protein [Cantharellus anzutake]